MSYQGGAVRFFCLLLVFLLPGFLGGCGKKMPPLPPETLLPGPVENLTVRQEGTSLVLSWQRPRTTAEGYPLTDLRGFRIWRGEAALAAARGCPPLLSPWQDIDLAYPVGAQVAEEEVRWRDEALVPGNRYFYQVTAFTQDKREGPPSPLISHAWDILPRPPAALTARAGDRLVSLSWAPVTRLLDGSIAPVALAYQIYRRQEGGAWLRLAPEPLTTTSFEDLTVANDAIYQYLVRTVRLVAGDTLESLDSPVVTARPEDLTPPAPVQQLIAVPTSQGIELRWLPSPEPDLAGYRVWRRAAGEPQFRLLTPRLLSQPYFVDREARRGQLYYYTVTAVDNSRRQNESQPTEPVAVISL